MKTSEFDFFLPDHLIARYPNKVRDQSRLLVLDRSNGNITDKVFYNIIDECNEGYLIVFNNSKVIPAKLSGRKKTGGKLDFLIERILDNYNVICHIRSNRALNMNDDILIENSSTKIIKRLNNMYQLKLSECSIWDLIDNYGKIPLPPYLKRSNELSDIKNYQTVYGKVPGSVAAPTAGLHFTEELISKIKHKGVKIAFITLHIGSGTFQPVKTNNIMDHTMHSEIVNVSKEVCDLIIKTKKLGNKIIAVGTTTVRSLESAAISGKIKPFFGESNIFLYPGIKFNIVDNMITNFHLPKSTLIMLVSAFASKKIIKKAYEHAIKRNYAFYSYGDAMFIK